MENVMYNKTNVKKQMFVIAMPYPKNKKLPDILEEDDGQVMYFKREKDAVNFLQNLYDERNIHIQALIDDNIEIMRVQ
jgi:superfamily II DNA/RNA helicase|tara:strand:+ start:325 stop:558 length:234 start_codon:yes stop_codon:yes gene_type:complete